MLEILSNAWSAIRYTLRQFRGSPVFTAAAILTLSLGIGGTTAIFTIVNQVMLRSLPVSDPGLLYRIGDGNDCCVEGGPQDRWGMYSYPLFEKLKDNLPEFDEVAAFQAGGSTFSVRREGSAVAAKPINAEYVTGNYFSTLGVKPFGGSLFTPADDSASAPPVVAISYQAWRAKFGSDPSVVGSVLVIEGHPFTVKGVAPPGFFGDTLKPDPPDVWVPLQHEFTIAGPSGLVKQSVGSWLRAIGRLRPGASTAGVGARLTGALRQWMIHDSGYPANWLTDIQRILPQQVINVTPGGSGVAAMKEDYGQSLRILLVVCSLVLLIACANVANLLLVRAVGRRGQTALRLAVGANRRQIVGQALTEALVLGIAGGFAGLVVAVIASRLLLALAFRSTQFLPISPLPSPMVLAFTFGVALLTGVIFGAAPAWFATRTDPVEALRGAGRGSNDNSSFARKALLIVQAALSVALVAGAAMLTRSLNKLEGQDFGFATEHRVEISMNPPPVTYNLPRLAALYRQLEDGMNRIPGVTGAGLALYNPLTDNWGEMIFVAGHPPPKLNENGGSSWDRVSTNYLQSLDVKLLRGRYFSARDNENSDNVAIVNEAFVKRFFKKGEDPLGQHFGLDMPENTGTFRIVGLVHDAKFAGFALRGPARPMFYVPLAQNVPYKDKLMARIEEGSHRVSGLLLTTNSSPGSLEPQLRRILSSIDPNLTINSVRTMKEQVELTFGQEHAVASLAGLFGVVALLLAAVGLYGVTAYTVAQRTNEIGIRMALGADRASVVGFVMNGAMIRLGIGLAAGVPLALLAGRLISSRLYGVSFWDPLALALAGGALLLSGVVAAMIPATVAASISPMHALRTE